MGPDMEGVQGVSGKRYEDQGPQPWRYAEIFKVSISGEEPVLAVAMNCIEAIEQAAAEIGMDAGMAKKMATVETPTPKEIVSCAKVRGLALEMRVRAEGYPDFFCLARCRMQAIMEAAFEWNANYFEIKDKARVAVSPRTLC